VRIAAFLLASFAVTQSSYTLVENWAPLAGGEAWGDVSGVDIDRDNTILVARRTTPFIIELTPQGKELKRWGDGLVVSPHGFRIDRDGFLWLTDFRTVNGKGQQVLKMTRDGNVVMRLGTAGVAGETESTFSGPCDVAIGHNGDIFVADGHQNNRIVKFSQDGKFIKAWGSKGAGQGQFSVPHTIAIDSQGRVFVGDRGNLRIQIFDQDGKWLDEWKQFGRPSGILITADDTLYVGDVSEPGGGITIGSARTGVVREKITGTLPESIAVDRDGSVYAGETTTGHTIRKFTR
jgi:DNA-binding beta-propeller fold protein YncE